MNEEFYKLLGEIISEGKFSNLTGRFEILNKDLYPNKKTLVRKDYLELQENKIYKMMLKDNSISNINTMKIAEFKREKSLDEQNNVIIKNKQLHLTSCGHVIELLMINIVVPIDKNCVDLNLKHIPYEKADISYKILNENWYDHKYYYKKYDFFKDENCIILYNRLIDNIDIVEKRWLRKVNRVSALKSKLLQLSENEDNCMKERI